MQQGSFIDVLLMFLGTILQTFGEMFGAAIRCCSFYANTTLFVAAAVALAAVLLGIKNGFRSKPLPAYVKGKGPGFWAWMAVIVLWVVVMLNYFDRQLLAVLNTSITSGEQGIAMTQAQFGMVTSGDVDDRTVLQLRGADLLAWSDGGERGLLYPGGSGAHLGLPPWLHALYGDGAAHERHLRRTDPRRVRCMDCQ